MLVVLKNMSLTLMVEKKPFFDDVLYFDGKAEDIFVEAAFNQQRALYLI